MADLLTRVQRELDERLAELRPLVDEARQLEQALAALNSDVETAGVSRFSRARRAQAAEAEPESPAPAVEPTPRPRSSTPGRSLPRSGPTLRSEPLPQQRRRSRTKDAEASVDPSDAAEARARASRNEADERRRRALAIITENPGTTAGNLALLLDTSVATMGSLLKRMEREGEIERAEKGYARRKESAAAES